MPVFKVLCRRDAFIDYVTEVEADVAAGFEPVTELSRERESETLNGARDESVDCVVRPWVRRNPESH